MARYSKRRRSRKGRSTSKPRLIMVPKNGIRL
ncbi:MAG: hypothetical protein [Malazfec virus 7]